MSDIFIYRAVDFDTAWEAGCAEMWAATRDGLGRSREGAFVDGANWAGRMLFAFVAWGEALQANYASSCREEVKVEVLKADSCYCEEGKK